MGMTTTQADDAVSLDRLVGGRVAWYMKHNNGPAWTQVGLAAELGIDQSALSKKLKGARPFTVWELYRVAECIGIGLDSITPAREQLTRPPLPVQRAGDGVPRRRSTDNGSDVQGVTGQYLELEPA